MPRGKASKIRNVTALKGAEGAAPETFGDRLSWLLDQFASRTEASTVAGVGIDQLAKYVRGGAKPTLEVMARLCLKKSVSLDWLWTGSGRRDEDNPPDESDVRIPIFDIRAGLGSGQTVEDEEPIDYFTLPKSVLVAHGMNPAGAEMGFGSGDSMRGTIEDQDPVIWDRTDREVRDKVFLMRRGGQLIVKRIQRRTDGTIILKSDNPAYEDEILPRDEADELEIIGRVGMVLRSL